MLDGREHGVASILGPTRYCWLGGWVHPNHRGQGIFQSLISHLSHTIRNQCPDQQIVADVPLKPLSSLYAHRRMGYRLYGRLDYVTVARRLVYHRFQALNDEVADALLNKRSE